MRRIIEVSFNFQVETRTDEHSTFGIGDASTNYTITVSGFTGTATISLDAQNGIGFTTMDQDHDLAPVSCANHFVGAW